MFYMLNRTGGGLEACQATNKKDEMNKYINYLTLFSSNREVFDYFSLLR